MARFLRSAGETLSDVGEGIQDRTGSAIESTLLSSMKVEEGLEQLSKAIESGTPKLAATASTLRGVSDSVKDIGWIVLGGLLALALMD